MGYFLGGALADRTASLTVLAATVLVGSAYLLVLPAFAGRLMWRLAHAHERAAVHAGLRGPPMPAEAGLAAR